MVSTVPRQCPETHSPSCPTRFALTRDEAVVVLFRLDVIEQAHVDREERAKVTRAIHLLTAKLWPDLGDLLDGNGGDVGWTR